MAKICITNSFLKTILILLNIIFIDLKVKTLPNMILITFSCFVILLEAILKVVYLTCK